MLSRASSQEPSSQASCCSREVEQFIQAITAALPASSSCLDSYSRAQATDQVCSKLIECCMSGWPARNQLSREMKDYWRFHGDLTLNDSLLLYQSRIVIPASMQQMTLEKIHHGHQDLQRCRMWVSSSVWWPGVSAAIERFVRTCPVCQKTTPPSREPLINNPLPRYPWEHIASDLFELRIVATC